MSSRGKGLDERKTGIIIRIPWKVVDYLETEGKVNKVIEKIVMDYYDGKMSEKSIDS